MVSTMSSTWIYFLTLCISWKIIDCGFVNEPCNEGNTLYITRYLKKIPNKMQCLDIEHIDKSLTKSRRFLEVYSLKSTRSIKTIYAEGIGLQAIPKVEKFTHLEEYHLSKNNIKFIPPKAFRKNKQLILLILSKNRIRSRKRTNLLVSSSVETLILSINNIIHIDGKTFAGLPSLKNLILDNNKIFKLPYISFAALPKLQYLRITNNPLQGLSVYLPEDVELKADVDNHVIKKK